MPQQYQITNLKSGGKTVALCVIKPNNQYIHESWCMGQQFNFSQHNCAIQTSIYGKNAQQTHINQVTLTFQNEEQNK